MTTTPCAPPVVLGELLPPAGRRSMTVLLVRRCCWCQCAHLHRTGQPAAGGWTREGSCGREYRVQLAPTQRAAGRRAA